MAEQKTNSGAAGPEQPQFAIQRIYIKDLSFEAPNTPAIFLEEWKPEVNMDLGTESAKLNDDTHEVVLTVTVSVKMADKTVFLVEVKQAGIFTLQHFPEDQISPMLGSVCPNILYPYAREVVTDAVVKGGFPQLYLAPVNFDALYQQQQSGQAAGDAAGDATN